ALSERDPAVGLDAVGVRRLEPAFVFPERLARVRAQRGDVALAGDDVHDALVDERRAFDLRLRRAVDRLHVQELHLLDVARVDLVQRRVALIPYFPAARWPI